jgi:hypothetical protein
LLANYQCSLQPVLNHIQISDVLQEFLCIPDQVKLIEFDNEKMRQMQHLFENEQNVDFSKHIKRVSELKNIVQKSKNGAPRLNFYRDLMIGGNDIFNYRMKKV